MGNIFKIIFNPTSGKGLAMKKVPQIEELMKQYGLEYEIAYTNNVGHAMEIARESSEKDYKAVVAAGGDGTINEVINGLMQAKNKGNKIPAFGVIPMGRGNDFACGANIPSNMEEAIKVLKDFKTVPMDVGKISGGYYPEGRYFGNGIGIGFDTIVGLEAAKMKNVHGFMAYVFGAIKTLIRYPKAPSIEISYDGKRVVRNSPQISVMNGKRMGGTFYMAPEASNHDGKFNLLISDHLSRRQMVQAISLLIKGRAGEHRQLMTDQAGSIIEIKSPKGGLVSHADGETICEDGTELIVECLAGQLDIISTAV